NRIRILLEGVSIEQARWRPAPDSWSLLEVINHLDDEEKQDFRVRLDTILHHPDQPWPPIDPGGWVVERHYNQRDPKESLDSFLRARQESLGWLKSLSSPNWEAVYEAPFGQITAGDMFASWVGHDLLHMRQLVELHWAYTGVLVDPYATNYAGSW
ncbi:MAG: DinB family protein, partial [Chloroflexi bacterium]|nr:DinB family protein [Chloroflexota bacterium]